LATVSAMMLAGCVAQAQPGTRGPPSLSVVPANFYRMKPTYRTYIIPPRTVPGKKGHHTEAPVIVIERINTPQAAPAAPAEPPQPPTSQPDKKKIDQRIDDIEEEIQHAKGHLREYYGTLSKGGRYEDNGR
jgi:hypothetical protein